MFLTYQWSDQCAQSPDLDKLHNAWGEEGGIMRWVVPPWLFQHSDLVHHQVCAFTVGAVFEINLVACGPVGLLCVMDGMGMAREDAPLSSLCSAEPEL